MKKNIFTISAEKNIGQRSEILKVQKGFTLIELLIAISIFMVFFTVMASSFIDIIRAQNVANETREMYSELRGFTDFVNDEMRGGTVDFFCYEQGTINNLDFNQASLVRCNAEGSNVTIDSGNNLRTISKDGLHSSVIKFTPGVAAIDGTFGNGIVEVKKFRNVDGAWAPESGYESFKRFAFGNVNVKNLRFDIYPKKDPAINSSDLSTQFQPMVVMALSVASSNPAVRFDLQYQTMITSRAQ